MSVSVSVCVCVCVCVCVFVSVSVCVCVACTQLTLIIIQTCICSRLQVRLRSRTLPIFGLLCNSTTAGKVTLPQSRSCSINCEQNWAKVLPAKARTCETQRHRYTETETESRTSFSHIMYCCQMPLGCCRTPEEDAIVKSISSNCWIAADDSVSSFPPFFCTNSEMCVSL